MFHFSKDHDAYRIDPADYAGKPFYVPARLLNELFLCVLQDMPQKQCLETLRFTSFEPQFDDDRARIQRFRRRQSPQQCLSSYIAAFLAIAPFFRASDARMTGVCDDRHTSTIKIMQESYDNKFKVYLTRKS
jgi:hypothetical protein